MRPPRSLRPFARRPLIPALLAAAALVPACAGGDDDDPLDGEDDDFLVDGKDDAYGIADGTSEACAILKLATLGDLDLLDHGVRLNRLAAQHIVAHRQGPDGVIDTDDDGWFRDLRQLDAVKHVGRQAFTRLRDHAARHPEFACGTVPLQLLAFNDFHGNLRPPTGSSGRIVTAAGPVDAGGAEFMATHIKALRATNPNTLVVAAGDIIGATPLVSALFHDEPTIESMNLMGLDIAGVGNHEFDEGIDELWRMQYGGCHPVDGCQDGDGFAGAAFAYLAANVTDEATGATVLPPFTIRRFGRARVAFIGMTLEGTPLVTTQEGTRGLRFADEADTVNALVPLLRARGVETIVVLLHEGGAATGLYNECAGISGPVFEIVQRFHPAVDVVVTGHTNAAHTCELDGRLVTSAAHAGRLVTDIDLELDELTGEPRTMTANNVIVTRTVERDAAQTALIERYEALAAPLANRVAGRVAGDLTRALTPAGESTMGLVIADAQLAGARADGAVAAFMNPGGVRADLLAATIAGGEQPGEATYGELFAVQPFGNTMMTLTVTGAQLELMLEQQWSLVGGAERANILQPSAGFTYTWDASRAIGDRVAPSSIRIGGAPVVPTATYRIAVNAFLAGGGDGFAVLVEGTDRVAGPLDIDALEAYLAAHSPLTPPATGRITRLP